jgi:tRNA(fMet)-specific endonuclease VapC
MLYKLNGPFVMNGRFVLDTNAVIALLNGDINVIGLLSQASWIAIPIIVKLEFLAFKNLSQSDVALFYQLESRVQIVDLANEDNSLLDKILSVRTEMNIKLPDAIVAAMAICNSANLVSNDSVFSKVSTLSVTQF